MAVDVYQKLAKVLDTLPQGFPSTENGVEFKILKKVFSPEQAELFCDLRMTFETAEQIAERTGRPLEGLEEKLTQMVDDGLIVSVNKQGTLIFRMMPYAVGIFELQMPHMDEEFAALNDEYMSTFLKGLLDNNPPAAQIIPIEEELSSSHEPQTYQQLSKLIDSMQSFQVADCTCRKEHKLLDKECDKSLGMCIGMSPFPHFYDDHPRGKAITKEEVKEHLRKAEEEGLVHLTSNYSEGLHYICNCCGCCCGILRGINRLDIPAWDVVNCDYYAEIDPELCVSCGVCADDRCQVNAIEELDDAYEITPEKCIGCGLCITTCPTEAIKLVKKSEEQIKSPPKNEREWLAVRAKMRGMDYSKFK